MHSGLTFGRALSLLVHLLAGHNSSFPQGRLMTYAGLKNPPGLQGKAVREHGTQVISASIDSPKFRCHYVDKIQDFDPRQRVSESFGPGISSLILRTLVLELDNTSRILL